MRFPFLSGFALERENRPVRRQFAIEALGNPVVAVGHHVLLRKPAQTRLARFDMAHAAPAPVQHDAARRQEVGQEDFQGFPGNMAIALRPIRQPARQPQQDGGRDTGGAGIVGKLVAVGSL